jgi:hypothetical protein
MHERLAFLSHVAAELVDEFGLDIEDWGEGASCDCRETAYSWPFSVRAATAT